MTGELEQRQDDELQFGEELYDQDPDSSEGAERFLQFGSGPGNGGVRFDQTAIRVNRHVWESGMRKRRGILTADSADYSDRAKGR